MIKSPIQKVTENLQNRAIGIIYGSYKPFSKEVLNKGSLKDENNTILDSVVLGKTLPLIKKYIDFNKKYFFIVYPRNKDSDSLHLQITGIWDPYNLSSEFKDQSQNPYEILKNFDLKDNYFSVRGKLIFVKIPEKELIIKITPTDTANKKKNKNKNKSFKLVLKGELPMNLINSFISLDALRVGNTLKMESFKVIENKSITID